ncbi:hypothetical protein F4815DRAFT_445107 [Daldinia loculata]|nr:hypothetical protein F4815DRAFT_445107 [Daldinia loculata]
MERLLEWQSQRATERGEAVAAERVGTKEKVADKIFEIVSMVKDPAPLSPMGVDEEMRRLLVQPSAEKVLVEALAEILDRPRCRPNAKIAEIKKTFADLQSPWETILPRQVRYRIVRDTLWDFKEGRGENIAGVIEKALVKWEGFEEHPEALDPADDDTEDEEEKGEE